MREQLALTIELEFTLADEDEKPLERFIFVVRRSSPEELRGTDVVYQKLLRERGINPDFLLKEIDEHGNTKSDAQRAQDFRNYMSYKGASVFGLIERHVESVRHEPLVKDIEQIDESDLSAHELFNQMDGAERATLGIQFMNKLNELYEKKSERLETLEEVKERLERPNMSEKQESTTQTAG